jgi:hypothetical protein
MRKGYNPKQPRVPKGSRLGGEWSFGGAGEIRSQIAAAKAAKLKKKAEDEAYKKAHPPKPTQMPKPVKDYYVQGFGGDTEFRGDAFVKARSEQEAKNLARASIDNKTGGFARLFASPVNMTPKFRATSYVKQRDLTPTQMPKPVTKPIKLPPPDLARVARLRAEERDRRDARRISKADRAELRDRKDRRGQ